MGVATQAVLNHDNALSGLHAEAGVGFAGNVLPVDAYTFLSKNAGVLVDVRSAPEWQFSGLPNLKETPSTLQTIAWKIYPQFAVNTQFVEQLKAAGVAENTPVFFLCKTGGRSTDAAIAATSAGYTHAYNITGGFEGAHNERGQRGTVDGWKAAQLPWEQH